MNKIISDAVANKFATANGGDRTASGAGKKFYRLIKRENDDQIKKKVVVIFCCFEFILAGRV
ncbi:hypothetical protein KZ773_27405 [Escherichia coli]|nr:hypothetical protein [Escherichia coli]